ncbi:MAG: SIR2 family protein [Tannerellaceae bacterium]|nr:SIR2 family protein [Tannerellaceae bacterium]
MEKQTVFFGNGFNRVYDLLPDWNSLLNEIANDNAPFNNKIPYTLQYESLLLGQPSRSTDLITNNGIPITNNGEFLMNSTNTELKIKTNICKRLSLTTSTIDLYMKLSDLDVENYITTNYDYYLRDTFKSNNSISIHPHNEEKVYSIRRKIDLLKNDKILCSIWHIHGEVDNPKSLMLGLDHYCGYVGKIDSYLKGKYKEVTEDIETRIKNKLCNADISWIDLFFSTDVHIVGFGLDYCETDIWYILNKRKRFFWKNPDLPKNKVFFYGDLREDTDKIYLLQKIDVEYIEVKVENYDYELQLKNILRDLGQKIGKR